MRGLAWCLLVVMRTPGGADPDLATVARKYGFSVTNLLGKAGPETFIRGLEEGLDPAEHGEVLLHFYTFGGFKSTAEWIASFRREL